MSQSLDNVVNGLLLKERELQDGIKTNKNQTFALASRLASGGDFDGIIDKESMKEYHETLKELALGNVDKERSVQAFMNAVKNLGDASDIKPDVDMSAKIIKAQREERGKLDDNLCAPDQEESYKKVCKELGDVNDKDDDDDDIEILNVDNIQSLKCPISGTFMNDPVKNTKCGHVYSRESIIFHLRNNKRSCPVPGCRNNNVTMSQIEKDELTEIKVRRAKKKEQMEKQTQSQNAEDLDDEEEEME